MHAAGTERKKPSIALCSRVNGFAGGDSEQVVRWAGWVFMPNDVRGCIDEGIGQKVSKKKIKIKNNQKRYLSAGVWLYICVGSELLDMTVLIGRDVRLSALNNVSYRRVYASCVSLASDRRLYA